MWGITVQTFEEKFREKYPDCRLEIEPISTTCEHFRVFVGNLPCSESMDRDLAFRWALEDIRSGALMIPPVHEQTEMFPLRG